MTTNHISDETLAAFIDGHTDPETRQRVIEHMATCTECYSTWESAADYAALEGEEETGTHDTNVRQGQFGGQKAPRRGWWGIAAAVVIAFVGFAFLRDRMFGTSGDLEALMRAAENQRSRAVRGRLSGFPYQKLETMRGPGDDDPLSNEKFPVMQAAAKIEKRATDRRSVENLHALAVAYLVQKDPASAVTVIEEAIRAAAGTSDILEAFRKVPDTALLNDASAAYYARGAGGSAQPDDYFLALEAAEAARKIANTPESLWNRALALEAQDQREAARAAWEDYLKADSTSPWAAEARKNLENLTEQSGSMPVPMDRQLQNALAANDETAVRAIVQAHRVETRVYAEEHLLPAWGSATIRSAGDRELQELTVLAAALEQVTGDRLIVDTVRAITTASPPIRVALAAAHAEYGEARELSVNEPTRMIEQFRNCAARFDAARSPFGAVARVREAGCLERAGAFQSALKTVEESVPSADSLAARGYLALAAQVEWTRAIILVDIGIPDPALTAYDRALVWFGRLGERSNEANVRARAAQAADMMGDTDAALNYRLAALRIASESGATCDQHGLLSVAAQALSSRNLVSSADVLFDRLIAMDRVSTVKSELCTALLFRSLHRAQHGNRPDASRDLSEASAACEKITDKPLREKLRELQEYAAGVVDDDEEAAVAHLDQAIEVANASGSRFRRALLYSRRAKAHLATHNVAAAQSDARTALLQISDQLTEVAQPAFRDSMTESVREIVARGIEVELAAGDTSAAFAAAEWQRQHVGSMDEQASAQPLDVVRRSLAPDAALLAYHVGMERLTMFAIRRNTADVHVTEIGATRLNREVDELRAAMRANDVAAIAAETASLYRAVIGPAGPLLGDVRVLLIVPDGALAGVPFAALRDPEGRALVQHFTLVYLPTAAAVVARASATVNSHSKAVLVAGAPDSGSGDVPLMQPDREIRDVAALYEKAVILPDDRAMPEAFLAAIVPATVIHYAGHAAANVRQPMRSALLLPAGEDGRTPRYLYASQIAAVRLQGCALVVLAGCGTGKADGRARSLGSLARAFLLAGAESVVGNLWDVEDNVSRYASKRIHQAVLSGASPAEAVRRVQLEMMTSAAPELRAPQAWASLTTLGGCDGTTGKPV